MTETEIERRVGTPKVVKPLRAAIREHVAPGQHLHFASTPSRSNAAILELGRQFQHTGATFTFSTTGMHSTAHLLGLLGLGRRYVACFFGDNYPTPRPNKLYQRLEESGAELEQWSLASYVAAFRAGARGERYAVTKSLRGSDIGRDLARRGSYFEAPDPAGGDERIGLVVAMRADVTFVHAAVADADGNALFSPPSCEGFHSALGATRGVIVTAERIVPSGELCRHPHLLPLPHRRVLAVCQAPRGAHPQPLHVIPEEYHELAYGDEVAQYELWRELTANDELFRKFSAEVLERDDELAYRDFVSKWKARHSERADSAPKTSPRAQVAFESREPQPHGDVARSAGVTAQHASSVSVGDRPRTNWASTSDGNRLAILAARAIVRRVVEGRIEAILAGIGQSFFAARLARLILERQGQCPELLVETGLSDFDALSADPFLLGYRNIVSSKRLTDVDHVLGSLVCGTASRCLGVVGAAEVDSEGNVNSTRSGGRLLVGSGGANDIASSAEEVLVVIRAKDERFPARVEYVTSPGARVLGIVSEWWELGRADAEAPWRVRQWIPTSSVGDGPAELPGWSIESTGTEPSALPTEEELELIAQMFEGHINPQPDRTAF